MGSISMAGEWTLQTSARHQRAGWVSCCSGVRVFFSSSSSLGGSQRMVAVAHGQRQGRAALCLGVPGIKGLLAAQSVQALSICASRAGSSTAQPAMWPPFSIRSPS